MWVESLYLLLLSRKSPVMVHYLQHLQEFLQILSGEERHILDIVQADICSVGGCMVLSTIAHGNKITFLMRYRHIYIYNICFKGKCHCSSLDCFLVLHMFLQLSFAWYEFPCEPKAQHDLCTRHVEASFARLAQRGITSDAGASASPVLDEFIPIEGCNLLVLSWLFLLRFF